jgi:predicted nucleic acid-binding protein
MIAADSSTVIAYIQGDTGLDVELFDASIAANEIVLPPVTLAEVFSDPRLPARHKALLGALSLLDLTDGYWLRAAASRATVLSHKLRARLADTLIAQSCIDHDVPLIARDGDFRHFKKYCGLKLA